MDGEAGRLYRILEWARVNGDVSTVSRIRMMVLPLTVKERIILDRVDATTVCSRAYLDAVRVAVKTVVGKECPL